MAERLVTLTTDFGEGSPYVATMKGVLFTLNPVVRLVDLGHSIPPQNLRHAAFFLSQCLPFFPAGTIHIIVVDPGVGTERALLHIEAAGQELLAPDNGCWTLAVGRLTDSPRVRRLTDTRFWRSQISSTFHGRDILASVAGHLSLGLFSAELGPLVSSWVRLDFPAPVLEAERLSGEVIFVDSFGNLLTNIPGEEFSRICRQPVRVRVGEREVERCVHTYGEGELGAAVALVSSSGCLEVAVNRGSAARVLGAQVGAKVEVTRAAKQG
jgi:hypothetical protein